MVLEGKRVGKWKADFKTLNAGPLDLLYELRN